MSLKLSEGETRQSRKAATRAALRRAGQERFEAQGYAGTNIGDIARAAGVAHGTFYVHFESKEALLDELLVEFNDEFARRLAPVIAERAAHGVPALVHATAGAFLDYWTANRSFVSWYVERTAAGLGVNDLRDGINPPMVRVLRAALAAEASDRRGAVANLDLVTHALLAMWMRVGLQYLFGSDTSRDDALDVLERLTRGVIDSALPPRQETCHA